MLACEVQQVVKFLVASACQPGRQIPSDWHMLQRGSGMGPRTTVSFFAELRRRNVIRVGAAYLVVAWLLIQVAETVFPLFGLDDAPARIVVIAAAIGFVPTLVFAWAFELTPEGFRREAEVDHDTEVSRRLSRLLDRLIMVFLALGLAYFAFDKFLLTPYRQAEELSAARELARQEGRSEAITGEPTAAGADTGEEDGWLVKR
jgi:adenylate cyclase